ncbi:MAG: HAMP domain-containing histidine kinase [Sediminibacterium sp. Gen4]|jgi:signal transduction histidine kinase|uniref:sensor histidine kinase n=1 Tax=unclassified Sediminibacterium TaxID=2635961 RepID=UPI0015B81297|nr:MULTISPECIES: HAMP domain-containing sensor histidine kinase [unclassified Sediminibacterium]MBW0160875.1 HAMP domain-containing histidine kinase [Sediminibacterium sp.]MBW0163009.1 HAMP domain-containing histidine kinase [Sediminibacterium sp.]NWK66756.1 HAMP domain-containing histidine kinase [Sediminibacterium sp. Gen4]
MKKVQLTLLLMMATILLLAAFEGYWLHKLYKDEYDGLRKEVDVSFRETMNKLQLGRFEKDTALVGEVFTTTLTSKKNNTTFQSDASVKKNARPSTFVYRSITPSDVLKKIPPDSIESVTVLKGAASGFSFKGAPNPALIELIMKQSQNAIDSPRRIVIRVDSAFHENLDGRTFERRNGVTISIQGKDTTGLKMLGDSMAKLSNRVFTMPMLRAAKTLEDRMRRTDSIRFTKAITPPADTILQFPSPVQKTVSSPIIRFLSSNKTINDSIPVKTVDSAYRVELNKTNKQLKFSIQFESYKDSSQKIWNLKRDSSNAVVTDKVFVGYTTPYAYQAKFEDTNMYVLGKMQMQIGGSLLVLLLVAGSFIVLYRNLLAQQRLAEIKNDFISNITHELKTPIATVGVAIEALRNFNAMQSPERTKEYLDISAAELQRLSLLVDKVLKLSMFEKQQIELNKEPFDLKELMQETLKIMKLQFDKQKASVTFTSSDHSFMLEADKLHITSVIYNLLDNALKYSKNNAQIQVNLDLVDHKSIVLKVSDNGMGIAPEYQGKIFDKFFRVPTGDKHNIKGYGLGLSYVAEVIKSHKGSISVDSEPEKGSTFTVTLPVSHK